jgi:hypothetical protein
MVARQSPRCGEFGFAMARRSVVGSCAWQHGVFVGAAAFEDGDKSNF